jgi:Glycosyltransferase family 25 (LPS biosynthesis protein)
MKAVAIVVKGNETSEFGYSRLVESSEKVGNDFKILKWNAVTPDQVEWFLSGAGVKWNYPWEGEVIDFATGLIKKAYPTANPLARIACACSHYTLWHECATKNEPMLVLEHDAAFVNKIDFNPDDTGAWIIGINNPLGATRKAKVYHDKILESNQQFVLAPWIDDQKVPQGLAGNSAYIIKPKGAKELLSLVETYGLWPNDAIMCRQLISRLGVTRKFYTTVQGLKSTTSL